MFIQILPKTEFQLSTVRPLLMKLLMRFWNHGWYRVLLRAADTLPDHRKKSYQNRMYSAYCFLACDYYKAHRYREAVAEFEKAMYIQSNMPQLYYNLALSYARLNEHRKGIRLLNKLNRVKPGQAKTYELLGDFYFHLGELERAYSLYRKASETGR